MDPFNAPPVTVNATTQPTASATTQPTAPIEPIAHKPQLPPQRVVKVIRGGVESSVTMNATDGSPDGATSDTQDPSDSKDSKNDPFDNN